MVQIPSGLKFRIVGRHRSGTPGLYPVKDFNPEATYKLVGCSYAQEQLKFLFVNDNKKLWWVDHEDCICLEEEYYGVLPGATSELGNNEGGAVHSTGRTRKPKGDSVQTETGSQE